jgi:hypothetical protein
MSAPFHFDTDGNVYEGERFICHCGTFGDASHIVDCLNRVTQPRSRSGGENPNMHPAGFSAGNWEIAPDMPTMIVDGPFDTAKEIVAQVSSVGNARLIVKAPRLFDLLECAKAFVYSSYHPSAMDLNREIRIVLEAVRGTSSDKPSKDKVPGGNA